MTTHRNIIIILLILFLGGCTSSSNYAPVVNGWRKVSSSQSLHVVRRGETLYSIAWRYGKDYRELAKINNLPRPYKIYPGEKIRLRGYPSTGLATKTRKKPPVRKKPIARSSIKPKARTKPKTSIKKKSPQPRQQVKLGPVKYWQFPAKGKIILGFKPSGYNSNKGVNIAGKRGEPVRASAAGEVVYSGSGLNGYGKLIIIKHNSAYLSAYAHNQKLLVKEGGYVKTGQKIATMGSTGANRVMLHFEIRRYGKPVNPMKYLKG